ncbi:MAG: hypothetical protein AAFN93_02710 [Bacteroidota bacterium]
MSKRVAEIISYVFHPMLMCTILVGLLYLFAPTIISPLDQSSILYVLSIIFLLTYIIPILSIGVLKITSSISSMKLENRKERLTPFIFISAYYGLTTYMFVVRLGLDGVIMVIFSTITLLIILLTIITTFFKISVHSAGIWGLLGFLVAINYKFPDSQLFWPILVVLILAGLVNASRLMLNAHSPKEVSLGSMLGLVLSVAAVFIFV